MYPAPPVTRTVAPLPANGEIRESERAHLLSHLLEIGLPELVPLGDNRERIRARERVVALLAELDAAVEDPLGDRAGLGVVRANFRAGRDQPFDDRNRGRLPHVVRARLERETPQRDGAALHLLEVLLH